MPFGGHDVQLLDAAFGGQRDVAKAALEAGANANGLPGQPLAPIAAATIAGNAGIIELLLDQGADPDRPVTTTSLGLAWAEFNSYTAATRLTKLGERALHLAARSGNVEIVRLLLKRSRADPNATDNKGRTPLFVTCNRKQVCVEVVRLLLEAGADPTLANENGLTPLHAGALGGHIVLVDMLYATAPSTLSSYSAIGETPLCVACYNDNESMVSRLLSLGAMQRTPLDNSSVCPLAMAVHKGFVGVVRVLINEGGIRTVGGRTVLPKALYVAVRFRRARILRLLLAVDGEEGRSEWANTNFCGTRLLLYGAAYCYPAAVSVLLQAGADEAARDSEGRIPRDVVGVDLRREGIQMDRGREVAIRRMLQRGPAYRARSWAWPSDEEADAGGSGGGDPAAAAAAAAAVLSPPPVMETPPVVGVRIIRPKENSNGKLFVRLIDRYCAKN